MVVKNNQYLLKVPAVKQQAVSKIEIKIVFPVRKQMNTCRH